MLHLVSTCIDHGEQNNGSAPFRDWVSSIDELTAPQRREAAAVLSDPPEGEASLAAIELGVGEERRCPHCGSGGAVSRGKSRGLRRFRGIATKCLDSYLSWFHLVVLGRQRQTKPAIRELSHYF